MNIRNTKSLILENHFYILCDFSYSINDIAIN